MSASQARIVELQRYLKIARDALEKIKNGTSDPYHVADIALEETWPLEKKQPLQGLVGHERRQRP